MEIDPVLREIISFVEIHCEPIKVALVINGFPLSGEIINSSAYKNYLKTLSEEITESKKNTLLNKNPNAGFLKKQKIEDEYVIPDNSVENMINQIMENIDFGKDPLNYILFQEKDKPPLRIKISSIDAFSIDVSKPPLSWLRSYKTEY